MLAAPHATAGQQSAPAETTLDRALAQVNGDVITQSEIERRIAFLDANPDFPSGISPADMLQTEINRRLIVQAAEKDFAAQMLERIREVARRQASGESDPRRLPARKDKDLEKAYYEDYLIRFYLDNKAYKPIQVTPAEVKDYYETHSGEFATPETVTIRQILIREGPRASEEAKKIIEKAAGRIAAGESFAEVAKDLSEGPYAPNGGLWPRQKRGGLVYDVEEKAFSMEPGETSDLFHTPLGWHMIKLESRTSAGRRPFAEVQEELYAKLLDQRRAAARSALVERLRKRAVIKILAQ